MAMQSSGPTQKRRGLTRTQVLIVVVLGVGNCLIFGILAWVLYSAMAAPPTSLPIEQQAAESTATPIPMTPTPTLVPPPVLDEGWVSHGQPGDGFTIALPASWIEMDLSAETLDAALAPAREHVPDLVNPRKEGWTTDVYRDSGLRLAAIDVQGSGHVYYPSVDVLWDTTDEAASLDEVVQEIMYSFPDLGIGVMANERLTLPSGEAERYELAYGAGDPLRRVQYLLLKDKAFCFVTFTWDAQAGDTYIPVVEKIMQTFRWAE
jgi:hypothetical protein